MPTITVVAPSNGLRDTFDTIHLLGIRIAKMAGRKWRAANGGEGMDLEEWRPYPEKPAD